MQNSQTWKKGRPKQPRVAEIFEDCGRINHMKSKYFHIFRKTNAVCFIKRSLLYKSVQI